MRRQGERPELIRWRLCGTNSPLPSWRNVYQHVEAATRWSRPKQFRAMQLQKAEERRTADAPDAALIRRPPYGQD